MDTQVIAPANQASGAASPRRTFRQRTAGLMEHILMKLDMGEGTARHERQYLKIANLIGATDKIIDAFAEDPSAATISNAAGRFTFEAGEWDQTETLKRFAREKNVACTIELSGNHTAVDLVGAERASVATFINELINHAAMELKNNETYESA